MQGVLDPQQQQAVSIHSGMLAAAGMPVVQPLPVGLDGAQQVRRRRSHAACCCMLAALRPGLRVACARCAAAGPPWVACLCRRLAMAGGWAGKGTQPWILKDW